MRRHAASPLLLGVGCALLWACDSSWVAARGESGEIVEPGPLELNEVRVGDCLQSLGGPDYEGWVVQVDAVPCATPHFYDAVAAYELEGGGTYREARVAAAAEDGCLERWAAGPAARYDDLELAHSFAFPSQASWDLGDRRVTCLVAMLDGSPLVGTRMARGSDGFSRGPWP